MGTENFKNEKFENENCLILMLKEFVFFKSQWFFKWGRKVSKMKIREHSVRRFCVISKPMGFSMGLEILKMKIHEHFC